MNIMQWGTMLWVWVQCHVKTVMIAGVSSAALIKKNDSKVLQIVSTCYNFKAALYTKTPYMGQELLLSLWDGCQHMTPHIITCCNQSSPVLLSSTEDLH
jgi:hypothetical protein